MKNKFNFISILLPLFFSFLIIKVNAQLIITPNLTAHQLVDIIADSNLIYTNEVYLGSANSRGSFTTGSNPTNLGLSSGIILSTGRVQDAVGPNSSGSTTTNNGSIGDPDLAALVPGYNVYDACVLIFDFVPTTNVIQLRYVFGSEEYPEFAGSSHNDVFGLFLSGPGINGTFSNNAVNIATIPGTNLPVSINNINANTNSQYYVNNHTVGQGTVEYDGFTVVMTATHYVIPHMTYKLKIAIGDGGDSAFDSAVFIEEGSFFNVANPVSVTYSMLNDSVAYRNCSSASLNMSFIQPVVNTDTICFEIMGTAVNGIDYQWIDSCIIIPQGTSDTAILVEPLYTAASTGIKTVKFILSVNPFLPIDTFVVYIDDYETLQVNFDNHHFCLGDTLHINANVVGGLQPFAYLWSTGHETESFILPPQQIPMSLTYTLTVTDACMPLPFSLIDTTVVTVFPKPTSTFTLNKDTLYTNEELMVTYSGTASNNASFSWDFGLANVLSGNGQGPYLMSYSLSASHSINLIVSDNNCSSDYTYKTVVVSSGSNVSEIKNISELTINNPVNDFLNVRIHVNAPTTLRFELVNILGVSYALEHALFLSEGMHTLNWTLENKLPDGLYLFQITDDDSVATTRKILKR